MYVLGNVTDFELRKRGRLMRDWDEENKDYNLTQGGLTPICIKDFSYSFPFLRSPFQIHVIEAKVSN